MGWSSALGNRSFGQVGVTDFTDPERARPGRSNVVEPTGFGLANAQNPCGHGCGRGWPCSTRSSQNSKRAPAVVASP
jgi:hypothetical protein